MLTRPHVNGTLTGCRDAARLCVKQAASITAGFITETVSLTHFSQRIRVSPNLPTTLCAESCQHRQFLPAGMTVINGGKVILQNSERNLLECTHNMYDVCFLGTPLKPITPSKTSEEGDDVLGDYTVGEHVWVNGVKPGVIAYLGETQFAPGQWAGVILNDLVGKNDGSVGGVRYFECQPLQGIFTRPSKLNRQPVGEGSDSLSTDSTQNQTQQGGGGGAPTGQRVVVPLREGLLNSAVKTGNESGSNMSDSGSVKKAGDKDLRVGDRVLVSNYVCY